MSFYLFLLFHYHSGLKCRGRLLNAVAKELCSIEFLNNRGIQPVIMPLFRLTVMDQYTAIVMDTGSALSRELSGGDDDVN